MKFAEQIDFLQKKNAEKSYEYTQKSMSCNLFGITNDFCQHIRYLWNEMNFIKSK